MREREKQTAGRKKQAEKRGASRGKELGERVAPTMRYGKEKLARGGVDERGKRRKRAGGRSRRRREGQA